MFLESFFHIIVLWHFVCEVYYQWFRSSLHVRQILIDLLLIVKASPLSISGWTLVEKVLMLVSLKRVSAAKGLIAFWSLAAMHVWMHAHVLFVYNYTSVHSSFCHILYTMVELNATLAHVYSSVTSRFTLCGVTLSAIYWRRIRRIWRTTPLMSPSKEIMNHMQSHIVLVWQCGVMAQFTTCTHRQMPTCMLYYVYRNIYTNTECSYHTKYI